MIFASGRLVAAGRWGERRVVGFQRRKQKTTQGFICLKGGTYPPIADQDGRVVLEEHERVGARFRLVAWTLFFSC